MDVGRKIATTLATFAAGFLATRMVTATWRLVAGEPPPKDETDLELPAVKVAIFAGLVGAATAVAQTLASRQVLAWSARQAERIGRERGR